MAKAARGPKAVSGGQDKATAKKARKKSKGKKAREHAAMLAANAVRRTRDAKGAGIIRPGGPRPAPPSSARHPAFEHDGKRHVLTFRRIEGLEAYWSCSCGRQLSGKHGAREDAGEWPILDRHCRVVKGSGLAALRQAAARAGRGGEPPGPPKALGGRSRPGREKSKSGATSTGGRVNGNKPSQNPGRPLLPWQRVAAASTPAAKQAPRLCPQCGINELNCRC
jgi:hypothetical protein